MLFLWFDSSVFCPLGGGDEEVVVVVPDSLGLLRLNENRLTNCSEFGFGDNTGGLVSFKSSLLWREETPNHRPEIGDGNSREEGPVDGCDPEILLSLLFE